MIERQERNDRTLLRQTVDISRIRPTGRGLESAHAPVLVFLPDDDRSIVARCMPTIDMRGASGDVRGDVVCAWLEEAMTRAVFQPDRLVTTGDLRIRIRRPLPVDVAVTVRAVVTEHRDRRIVVRAVIVSGHDGRIVADARTTWIEAGSRRDDHRRRRCFATAELDRP